MNGKVMTIKKWCEKYSKSYTYTRKLCCQGKIKAAYRDKSLKWMINDDNGGESGRKNEN